MLATFAVASRAMRTHRPAARPSSVTSIYDGFPAYTENEALRRDVERLRKDPRTREAAARARLNMVRANEVVVPLN